MDPAPRSHPAYRYRAFRRLWLGGVLLSLGNWSERLIIGWFALVTTGSPFFTSATFAVRQAPGMLIAPLAGAIADRVSRSRLILVVAIYRAALTAALAWMAWREVGSGWVLLGVGLAGVAGSFELPATQGLIADVVPERSRMNAVALWSIGARAVGALGALAGGLVIAALGIPLALLAGAGVFLLGGLVIGTMAPAARREGAAAAGVASGRATAAGPVAAGPARSVARPAARPPVAETLRAVRDDVVAGLRLMVSTATMRALLMAAVVVEIFGFAYNSVLPVVARDMLGVGEVGLGTIGMAAGIGSVGGVAILSLLGDYRHKGLLLIGICLAFGTFMLLFASSSSFWAALVLVGGLGASAAAFDAMQWTLLQAGVPDRMRGRALSAWVFAIGFGWIGHLGLGAVAELLHVRWALGGAGVLLLLTGLLLLATARSVRRA